MEASHPRRRRAVAASFASIGALAVAGLLLVRCDDSSATGRSGSEPASAEELRDHGPSDEALAALDDPGEAAGPVTTTTADPPASADGDTGEAAATTTTTAPAALPEAECGVVQQVLLPPAALITDEDFVPLEERPGGAALPVTADAVVAVADLVPSDQRRAWEPVVASFEELAREGGSLDDAAQARFQAARDASEGWGRQVCPGAPPSWRCNAFGNRSANPEPTESDGPSASGVVEEERDGSDAVVVDQVPGAQLWAWLDADGFVARTVQVERVGDGWAVTRRHTCLDPG